MSEQRQLLEDYVVRYDEAVLAAIVWRHGPVVNGKGIAPLFEKWLSSLPVFEHFGQENSSAEHLEGTSSIPFGPFTCLID
jgi:hypothetical protein